MAIENIMYFALGLLVAGLIALLVMPAVWRRAVRLTKKRIEAATPMTMAEFRADKDQLRAEFALSTRRLEMNVETLRRRLAEQLGDINRNKTEVGAILGERDNQLAVMRELEQREAEARNRILELEKQGADLAQKLRMRDREFAEKSSQLDEARAALQTRNANPPRLEGVTLTGDYENDTRELAAQIEAERKRGELLEGQNRQLIAKLEGARPAADGAAPEAARDGLVAAEAHMAEAQTRVAALLEQTGGVGLEAEAAPRLLLAEKLSVEDELEALKTKVLTVESSLAADWDTDRMEPAQLRERLNDIAADVARLVYAIDESSTITPAEGESLLARVQKFADAGTLTPASGLRSALENKQRNGAAPERKSEQAAAGEGG